MKRNKLLILTFLINFLILGNNILFAQTLNIDSLKKEIISKVEKREFNSNLFEMIYNVVDYHKSKNPNEGIVFIKNILEFDNQAKSIENRDTYYSSLAKLYSSIDDIQSAKYFYEKSFKLYKNKKNYIAAAWNLIGLGNLFYRSDNFQTASFYYQKSLTYFELDYKIKKSEFDFRFGKSVAFYNIGLSLLNQKKSDSAFKFFQLGYELRNKNDDTVGLQLGNLYLGRYYLRVKKYDSSLYHFKRSLSYNILQNNKLNLLFSSIEIKGWVYENMADVYSIVNKVDSAAILYKKSLAIQDSITNHLEYIKTGINFSNFLIDNKRYEEALKFQEYILRLAKSSNFLSLKLKILNQLYITNQLMNKTEMALDYLDKYLHLKDSLYKQSLHNTISNHVINLEIDKTIEKIDELNKDKIIAEEKIHSGIYFMYLIGFIIVIIFVVSLLLVKQFVKRKQIAALLNNQHKQLTEINEKLLKSDTDLANKNTELTMINKILDDNRTSKENIFNILSNDLRKILNPMTTIYSTIEANYNQYSDKEKKQLIDYVKNNSNQLFAMLENILTWSRSSRGLIDNHPEVYNIRNLFVELLSIFHENIKLKNIRISNKVNEGLLGYFDYDLIKFVFHSLISNGIKYSKHNSDIIIDASVLNNGIIISIMDNGIGMSQNQLKSIFEFSSNKSEIGTDGETGTGLSLVLANEFVKLNNGNIWFESKLGIGTTVYIRLPIKRDDISEDVTTQIEFKKFSQRSFTKNG